MKAPQKDWVPLSTLVARKPLNLLTKVMAESQALPRTTPEDWQSFHVGADS